MKTTQEKAKELHNKQSILSQLREILFSPDWNTYPLNKKLLIIKKIEEICGAFPGTKMMRKKIDEYLAK